MTGLVTERAVHEFAAQHTAPSFMPRRLSSLGAAAATSIIVACLMALAMMTGVLPTHLVAQEVAIADNGYSFAQANSPERKPAQPVEAAQPAVTPVPAIPPLPSTLPAKLALTPSTASAPPAAAAPSIIEATQEILPAGALPIAPGVPLVGKDTVGVPAAGNSLVNGQPSTRRAKARKATPYNKNQARRLAAVRKPPGKTRQQVIAELMRAQRDGSYRAAAETYR